MLSPTVEFQSNSAFEIYRPLTIGRRLVVVGRATGGPMHEPIIIYNEQLAENIFGSGPLVDRYRDVKQVNEEADVVCIRIENREFDHVYRALEAYDFDLIYIDNFRFGSSETEIQQFIDFAQSKEQLGSLIHGFFDLSLYEDKEVISQLIASFTFEDMIDTYERGKYFSVVSNQVAGHQAGAIYAGHILALEPGVSPVNKTIDVKLQQEWSKEELIELQQMGVVAFRNTFKNGVVCANSTCAVQTPESAHKNIANFRIVQYLVQELSNALQDRIGRVQNTMQIEKVYEIVEGKLTEYEESDRIRQGDYSIIFNNQEGTILINILLVPIFTVESIRAYSQVRIYR